MSAAGTEPALTGRCAIVTGSGRNIGKAIALGFARAGAAVVVNGHRDRAAVDAVVAQIHAEGGRAIGVMADVSDNDAIAALVRQASDAFGAVDIAVSNVSVRRKQPFLEISVEDWRTIIDTNLGSAFYLARNVLPGMQARGYGRIIHISGVDGFAGHLQDRVHNIACKAAVHAMVKGLSIEFARYGITANTVAPGHIDTERDWSQYGPRESWMQSRLAHIPAGRFGHVDDVAAACLFLAGESGSFVTGQAIHVNGGQFMY